MDGSIVVGLWGIKASERRFIQADQRERGLSHAPFLKNYFLKIKSIIVGAPIFLGRK